MTHNPVTFASFALREAIDNACVSPGRICEGDGMKLTSVMSFVSFLSIVILALAISLPAQLNAAPQAQGQPLTSPTPSAPQLWRDPDRIEELKDLLFDFDTYDSTSEQAVLEADARWLKDHPNVRVKLAGHADPRGDIAYNLVLSQRRAETIKQELIRMGVAENQIVFATGWGKLYPNCLESTDECWKQNRRVDFVRAID
jgi:outer membrane protein OmpA-like peptidoglycan-associated protein